MGCTVSHHSHRVVPTHPVSADGPERKLSGTPKIQSRTSFPSLSNCDSPSTFASELSVSRIKSETQTSIQSFEAPPILYSVDLAANKVTSCNLDTKKRVINDLSRAALHSSKPSFIPLNPMQEEVFDHLVGASTILISENCLYFVGQKHFAYDFKQNLFSYKGNRAHSGVKNSTLCRVGNEIFAFSGEDTNGYSVKCEKYNMAQNVWTPIASLSKPYYKGSACMFTDSDGSTKIVLAGGLSQKGSIAPNQTIAIYDLASDTWVESKFTWKLPIFFDPLIPPFPLIDCKLYKFCLVSVQDDKIHMNFISLKTGKTSSKIKPYPKENIQRPVLESICMIEGTLCLMISEKDRPDLQNIGISFTPKPSLMFATLI